MSKKAGKPIADGSRRRALCQLAAFMAGSPLIEWQAFAQQAVPVAEPTAGQTAASLRPPIIRTPAYRDEIMKVINLHEFEAIARKKISAPAYDYIAAGAADDLTLEANRAAFGDFWIRRKVMIDTTKIDTTVELLGQTLEHPILLGPVGPRNLLNPSGERLTIQAAAHTKAIVVQASPNALQEAAKQGGTPKWWAATLGHATEEQAATWAKRNEDLGASALCVTVDYPYAGARDRPSRYKWEADWLRTGMFSTSEGGVTFQAGMLDPYTPDLTWRWMKWVRSASKLPIVVKGVLTSEDAALCVDNGAQAIVVSNHGARTLDGMGGTLHALPDVVAGAKGRVPVLVDGGIRRGGDIVKAVALGARAILIGRPYLWGLGAFGQEGVQRVVELLHGELRTALALSGAGTMRALDRTFIRPAWQPYKRA